MLSPLLVKRTPRGIRMIITGFTGGYALPPDIARQTDHLVHLCAGSGIVPNYSILKYALASGLPLRHTLIYSNRTLRDVIYRRALEDLRDRHPERLRIIHTLTREPDTSPDVGDVRRGRISLGLLREAIPDPSAVRVYACGPAVGAHERQAAREKGADPAPRFMEATLSLLEQIGVKKEQIKRESYG